MAEERENGGDRGPMGFNSMLKEVQELADKYELTLAF